MDRHIHVCQIVSIAPELRAGDSVYLSGPVYTARDAAHKRLCGLMDAGEPLPIEISGAVIYYAGPTPAREGQAIGSCGPTTSSRMDLYTPRLLDMGLAAMVGKGERGPKVVEAIRRNRAVYFCAIGGAGALAAAAVKSRRTVAFEDLGCEAINLLEFEDFHVYVAIDCHGGNIFESGRRAYVAFRG